ncbi:hypothetical protein DCS_02680 [Drechmeria coniospora]|uniref:Uncharacterized protein n=1 Tax=Drechmeria coniospora TaxID=98403 RepID=A0A151GWR2_DRECN|nr:hypothetical protein DCS_02680 [Drechmeria coniospora]KYK61538.1 hypothetical protein DCS_02680 [Drechmeria coniospora]
MDDDGDEDALPPSGSHQRRYTPPRDGIAADAAGLCLNTHADPLEPPTSKRSTTGEDLGSSYRLKVCLSTSFKAPSSASQVLATPIKVERFDSSHCSEPISVLWTRTIRNRAAAATATATASATATATEIATEIARDALPLRHRHRCPHRPCRHGRLGRGSTGRSEAVPDSDVDVGVLDLRSSVLRDGIDPYLSLRVPDTRADRRQQISLRWTLSGGLQHLLRADQLRKAGPDADGSLNLAGPSIPPKATDQLMWVYP